MFFGFDLKEIFYFPFKDEEARKYLLIGVAVSLAALIVPVVPYFFLIGYAVLIARQVLKRESPHMVMWNDWGEIFKDGAKIFGIRFIFSLPILILVMPIVLFSFALPFFGSGSNSPESSPIFAVFMGIFGLSMCILIPLSLVLAVIIPAAEMHAVDQNDFTAAFRFREWWEIFRANTTGFLAAFGIYYLATIALTFAIQILMITVILSCLLPILLPAITAYITLIMYVTIAQAYRDGKAKLAENRAVAA